MSSETGQQGQFFISRGSFAPISTAIVSGLEAYEEEWARSTLLLLKPHLADESRLDIGSDAGDVRVLKELRAYEVSMVENFFLAAPRLINPREMNEFVEIFSQILILDIENALPVIKKYRRIDDDTSIMGFAYNLFFLLYETTPTATHRLIIFMKQALALRAFCWAATARAIDAGDTATELEEQARQFTREVTELPGRKI